MNGYKTGSEVNDSMFMYQKMHQKYDKIAEGEPVPRRVQKIDSAG
jgi:hypothetical protein